MSELLFQASITSYFVSHVLTDSSHVAKLREIGNNFRGIVCMLCEHAAYWKHKD